jgi:CRP/FNR family transcriptional regulator, cyclic AMP receptor protein
MVTSGSDQRVRVADAFPELVHALDPEQQRLVRQYALATLDEVPAGLWHPRKELQPGPGHLGLLVLEGLLTRDVVLGETLATELVGRGDILRPADHDGQDAPVPFDVVWHVLEPARIAILDREFARIIGRWPEAMEVLMHGAVGRAQSLAVNLAVSHLRRVDVRLHVLMWYLADRWGKVTPDGVVLSVRLSHRLLGSLVGARRPTVTTALAQLAEAGTVVPYGLEGWLLSGPVPHTSDFDTASGSAIRLRPVSVAAAADTSTAWRFPRTRSSS